MFALSALGQVQTEVPPVVTGAKSAIVEHIKIHGAGLDGNLEGNATDRDVLVLLPPTYASQKNRRYPVVYALHGYSIGAEQWSKEIHVPQTIEGAFLKLRIARQLDPLDAVWLHVVPLPNPVHDRSRHAKVSSERAHTPVWAAVAWASFQGGIEDSLFQFRRQDLRRALAPANPGNRGHAFLREPGIVMSDQSSAVQASMNLVTGQ